MHRTVSLPAVLLSIAGLMVLGRVNHAELRFWARKTRGRAVNLNQNWLTRPIRSIHSRIYCSGGCSSTALKRLRCALDHSDGCAEHEIHAVSILSRILVERRTVLLTKLWA